MNLFIMYLELKYLTFCLIVMVISIKIRCRCAWLLQKNKSLGCTYLKYADDKDFAGSKKVMEKYCN